MSKLPYFLTPNYYPAFLDAANLIFLQRISLITCNIDSLIKRNSDVFHVGKKTVQRIVIQEKWRTPVYTLMPLSSNDDIYQSIKSGNRTGYQDYLNTSVGNNDLSYVYINDNLFYTKEMIDVFFIHCNVTYEPLAKALSGYILYSIDYEYSPCIELVSQITNHSIGWSRPKFFISSQDAFGPKRLWVESSFFSDKPSADHCCNALNECVVRIKFQRTRPEFKEKYKQFTREAKRTVEVVKEYLKKIVKIADKLTVVELKLNAKLFFSDSFDANRSSQDLFEAALGYRKKFFKYLQNRDYFKDMNGLLWRLDYDVAKRQYFYVIHFFFYVLEDKQKKIADLSAEWKNITGNKGSMEYSENSNQPDYFLDDLDLTDVNIKERLIKHILAYYERDALGHVKTYGKKGVSFGKKAIVPLSANEMEKRKKKILGNIEKIAKKLYNNND